MSKRHAIIAAVAIMAAVLAAGFLFWRKKEALTPSTTTAPLAEKTGAGIGVALFDKSQNPIADKLAETNPFGANLNPFEKETNPLKALYQNPFQ